MPRKHKVWLLVGVSVVASICGNAIAAETTRTFLGHHCRFTLPSDDWSWTDKAIPNVLFVAGNSKGWVVNLSTVPVTGGVKIDPEFVKGFDESFYVTGQIEKRAGAFATFRGLRSYQTMGKLPDGKTSATSVFTAHGLVYTLSVVGGVEPIENDPSYESILLAFEFTSPPDPSSGNPGTVLPQSADRGNRETAPLTEWVGRIVDACVVGVVVIIGFLLALRRR
jgi:hypothetical protein